ncbi:MAG: hypothetical protein GY820_41280 [Gammaproteobacteria bacterium]|nr:hypothetical protein [Gammaproteobacteria bacterium]
MIGKRDCVPIARRRRTKKAPLFDNIVATIFYFSKLPLLLHKVKDKNTNVDKKRHGGKLAGAGAGAGRQLLKYKMDFRRVLVTVSGKFKTTENVRRKA